jgi:hypothetical protein
MASQVEQQRRTQPCRNNCGIETFFDAKLGRTDRGGWIPMQLDSIGQVVKYECPNKPKKIKKQKHREQQRPPQLSSSTTTDLSKEVAAIKSHLLALVSRLDRIEQQMMMKH